MQFLSYFNKFIKCKTPETVLLNNLKWIYSHQKATSHLFCHLNCLTAFRDEGSTGFKMVQTHLCEAKMSVIRYTPTTSRMTLFVAVVKDESGSELP